MAAFDQASPPGQVGEVSASVKTENYRGQVEKSITVTTDDPTRSVVNLRIKANVVGSIDHPAATRARVSDRTQLGLLGQVDHPQGRDGERRASSS